MAKEKEKTCEVCENQNVCEQNENLSYKWPVLLQSLQLSRKKTDTGYDNKNVC